MVFTELIEQIRNFALSVKQPGCTETVAPAVQEGVDEMVAAVVGGGAVEVLIDNMKAYKVNKQGVYAAMATMLTLCDRNGLYKEDLGSNGAVEAVISVMEDAESTDEERFFCMSTLLRLCQASKANCRRIGSKGVDLVVSAISKRHTSTLLPTLVTLWLQEGQVLYQVASKNGVLAMIVVAMSTYANVAEVQNPAIAMLSMLIPLKGAGIEFHKQGGVPLMIKAMKACEKDVQIQVGGAVLLGQLLDMRNRVLALDVIKNGGIHAILRAFKIMAIHASELYKTRQQKIIMACFTCVQDVLVDYAEHRALAIKEGCFEAIRKILPVDVANATLQEACVLLLVRLVMSDSGVDEDASLRFVQAGLMPHVIEAIKMHPKHELVTVCVLMIEHVAYINLDFELACEGSIPAMVAAMKSNAPSSDISTACCSALISFHGSPERYDSCKLMAKLGVVRLAMDIAHAHKDENRQKAISCAACIGNRRHDAFSAIVEKDVDLVINVMRKATGSLYMQVAGIQFMHTCCCYSACLQNYIGSVGGHQLIIQAAKARMSTDELASIIMPAFAALGEFARNNRKNQDRFTESDLQLIVRAVNAHKKNALVFTIGHATLGYITKNHPTNYAIVQQLAPNLLPEPGTESSGPHRGDMHVREGNNTARFTGSHEAKMQAPREKASILSTHIKRTTQGCSSCGKTAFEAGLKILLKCSVCSIAPAYCSAECQKAEWPKHKAECKANRIT